MKNKIAILVTLAVIFLVALFWTRSQTEFKRDGGDTSGLVYDNTPLDDLVSRDTDGDGILDWEETLWNTDPTKTDTDDDGIKDDAEVARLKAEAGVDPDSLAYSAEAENLTQTEKFAQELFATAVALNQSGTIDEATIEAITDSLVENIQNSTNTKTFTIADIKTIKDGSKEAVRTYALELSAIQNKYPPGVDVLVLLMASIDENGDINAEALEMLKPTIIQIKNVIRELTSTNTPEYLAPMHLSIINSLQAMAEGLESIIKLDGDPAMAFGGIDQYEQSSMELMVYLSQLAALVNLKLNN